MKTKLYTVGHTKVRQRPSINSAWGENTMNDYRHQRLDGVWRSPCKTVLGKMQRCLMELLGRILVYARAHLDDCSNAEDHEKYECNNG